VRRRRKALASPSVGSEDVSSLLLLVFYLMRMGNKLNLSSAVYAPLAMYQRSEGEAQQCFLPFCSRTECE